MRINSYLRIIAMFLSLLIITLPIAFAEELNLVYDKNGNLVTGDSFYREYNELNQLVTVREGNISTGDVLERFTWHPIAERILIKDVYENNVLNYSVYYVSDEFVRIENSSGNYTEKFIYQNGILVAQVNTDGGKEFLHPDHLGSTSLITDATGAVIADDYYSPFGEIIEGGDSRFSYEGKEFDDKVQDFDFHFRKYRPDWGTFTQPDTLIQNVYDPQSLNRYSFERNNPVKYVDEEGNYWQAIAVIAGAAFGYGFIEGFAQSVSNQAFSGQGIDYGLAAKQGAYRGGVYTIGATVSVITFIATKGAVRITPTEGMEIAGNIADVASDISKPEPKKEYVGDESDRIVCEFGDCPDTVDGTANDGTPGDTTNPPNQGQVKISPSNPSTDANSASYVTKNSLQSAINAAIAAGGGFVSGVGYVSSTGTVSPTNNPTFVPKSAGGSGNAGASKCRATGTASCNGN